MTEDTRPQETPEEAYDDVVDAIKNLAQWMLREGFDEQETRDWLQDLVGDAKADAIRAAVKASA